jgi:hypothetical protein
MRDLLADILEVEAYFEQRADAEYSTESASPTGNEEMRMLVMVKAIADRLAASLPVSGADALNARRYEWLVENIHKLPYPDAWGSKPWLDQTIDAAIAASPSGVGGGES